MAGSASGADPTILYDFPRIENLALSVSGHRTAAVTVCADLPTENTTGLKRAAMSQDISHIRDREKTPG
jgi:hypothetical protein